MKRTATRNCGDAGGATRTLETTGSAFSTPVGAMTLSVPDPVAQGRASAQPPGPWRAAQQQASGLMQRPQHRSAEAARGAKSGPARASARTIATMRGFTKGILPSAAARGERDASVAHQED